MADSPHTIKQLFEQRLQKFTYRTALECDGETVTYGALDRRSNALANALVERGVEPESRVAIIMANCVESVVARLAVIKAGATMLPLTSLLSGPELEYMITDARAMTVFCTPDFHDEVASIRDASPHVEYCLTTATAHIPSGFHSVTELIESADDNGAPAVSLTEDSIAGHYYTGGTTGRPKGAIHTQRARAMMMYSVIAELDVTSEDRMFFMTSLQRSAGTFLHAGLLAGARITIADGFDAGAALDHVDGGATWTFMVPTMLYDILDHPALEDVDTTSLRTVAYGAAPITPGRLRDALDRFGPVFVQFYGSTEVPNLVTSLGKREHELAVTTDRTDLLSSAGYPALMASVRIIDEETGESLPAGQAGEVVARTPYQMSGYFEQPEKTAETIRDGWIHTGDLGKFDDDGYLYLLDRDDDMIISGGMNVYTTEVEDVLDQHPGVKLVAVIGVPDDKWGEAVKAVVVPYEDETLTAETLIEFAGERLAPYKRPKTVDFVEDLPTTPFGKIDKKELLRPYWGDDERQIN